MVIWISMMSVVISLFIFWFGLFEFLLYLCEFCYWLNNLIYFFIKPTLYLIDPLDCFLRFQFINLCFKFYYFLPLACFLSFCESCFNSLNCVAKVFMWALFPLINACRAMNFPCNTLLLCSTSFDSCILIFVCF